MTALKWDEPDEREFQIGVDRGVLYPSDGPGVAWNGLTGIEESADTELKSYYLDGVKFLENLFPGDYQGKMTAFTYPEEFERIQGMGSMDPGFYFHDQPAKSFGLSYRTRIGNAIEGADFSYRVHLLYNVFANPDAIGFTTLEDSNVTPVQFSWSLTGTPPKMKAPFRPTVHVSLDLTETDPDTLHSIETILYGTEDADPRQPSIDELAQFFGYLGALIIVDHGDGTWSAIDSSDTYISMLDPTTFQIANADATYLDEDMYTVSSTGLDEDQDQV